VEASAKTCACQGSSKVGSSSDQTTYYAAALAALEHLIVANGSVTIGGFPSELKNGELPI
jgi:hypothetical protein